jgi:hypothetical protein
MTPRRLSRAFRPLPEAAREGRSALRAALTEWGMSDFYEAASVVLTELITNALPSEDVIDVELYPSEDLRFVHIEVHDTNTELPKQRCPDEDEECGRGLLVVNELATEWGFRLAPRGKVVFAVLDRQDIADMTSEVR